MAKSVKACVAKAAAKKAKRTNVRFPSVVCCGGGSTLPGGGFHGGGSTLPGGGFHSAE